MLQYSWCGRKVVINGERAYLLTGLGDRILYRKEGDVLHYVGGCFTDEGVRDWLAGLPVEGYPLATNYTRPQMIPMRSLQPVHGPQAKPGPSEYKGI